LNFNNETQYNVQLNSFLTLLEDKINSFETLRALKESFPFYDNPFTEGSKLLKSMFPNGLSSNKKLTMSFVEGLKNQDNYEASQYAKLSHVDKLISSVNLAIEGYHPVFRPGDNSLERVHSNSFYNKKLDINTIKAEFFNDITSALISEVEYFKNLYKEDSKYYKGDLQNTKNIVEKSIFYDILQKAKLEKVFNNAVIEDGSLTPENIRLFEENFDAYFTEMVENTKNYLINFNIITKLKDGYANNSLSNLNKEQTEKFSEGVLNKILTYVLAERSMWNIEQMRLFSGHPMYYDTADNFFKRMSAMVGTKKRTLADEVSIPLVEKYFPRLVTKRTYKLGDKKYNKYQKGSKAIVTSAVFNDFIVSSNLVKEVFSQNEFKNFNTNEYNKMNEADAIAYFHLDFYRDLRIYSGDWTNADERLYRWVNRKGESSIEYKNLDGTIETIADESQLINLDGSRTVFNMLKPQYFGPLAEKGFIPSMYKLGAVPILPNTDLIKFPNIAKVLKKMKDSNIDIITFNSANKVGTKLNETGTIQDLFTHQKLGDSIVGKLNSETWITQDTYLDFWGIQLDTGNKLKKEAPSGTQFSKLILSNIYGEDVKTDPELDGLAKQFKKITQEIIDLGVKSLYKELELTKVDGNYTTESVKRLIDILHKETSRRSGTAAVLESIELLNHYINKGMGLDILSNRDKIENILAAIADSRVLSQSRNGSGFIQMPSTLFEITPDGVRYIDSNLQYMSNTNVKLLPNGVMQVMLPDRFREQFKQRTLIDYKVVDGKQEIDYLNISEEALQMIGFRIPTSGLNSIERIQVVDFLPIEYGDTVLLPSEIVAKAGSDFDIDKLNIFIKNLVKKDGILVPEQYKEGEKNSKGALQNELIDISWKILRHKNNRVQHLESIGTEKVHEQRDRIVEARNVQTKKPTFTDIVFNLPYTSDVTQRNITSKQLTGIAALHITDHQLAIQHGYLLPNRWDFEEGSYNVKEFRVSIGYTKTVDGYYISSNLNQLLNSSVDGAKNPLFFDLNITLDNANTIFTLVRAGMSLRNIMTFLNQPVIREYSRMKELKKSILNGNLEVPLTNDIIVNSLETKLGEATTSVVTFAEMEAMLEDSTITKNKEKQRKVLDLYLTVENDANMLNDYMQATRLDTEGTGKSTSELDYKLFIADKVFNKEFNVIGSDAVLKEGGFLKPHYEALQSIQELFKPFFITSNTDFVSGDNNNLKLYQENYKNLLNKLANNRYLPYDTKIKILDTYKSDFIEAQVLNSPITIMGKTYGTIFNKLEYLITDTAGSKSVAKRLLEYKKLYPFNPLLENLQPILGSEYLKLNQLPEAKPVDHVKLYDQRLDPAEANTYMEAFRDLLYNPETAEFAKDLVALTLIQSGIKTSPLTYTKLIPPEVYMEIVSSAFNNPIINANAYDGLFILNNYHIEELIPTIYNPKRRNSRFISKYFTEPSDYRNLQADKREDYKRSGKPIKETIPVIEINLNDRIKESGNVSENLLAILGIEIKEGKTKYRIRPLGYRDLVRNRMISGYNIANINKIIVERVQPTKKTKISVSKTSKTYKTPADNLKNKFKCDL
jgi:hypothetical protein